MKSNFRRIVEIIGVAFIIGLSFFLVYRYALGYPLKKSLSMGVFVSIPSGLWAYLQQLKRGNVLGNKEGKV